MPEDSSPTKSKHRPDIDGLRAVAILAVVGYHAYPGLFKGGFIGVDVFFVVSGFLITTIILKSLEQNRFSFLEFYVRRVRRILPALVLILLAVFAIGWFVLYTDEYRQLGRHMFGGATFSSNFLLWHESGYFDTSSDRKVLVHLWSLAIEEQFYLLFPLALWASWKRHLRPLVVIAVIGVASFIWSVSVAATNPTMDFYSPQTRFWELMLGAALACASLHASGWLPALRSRVDQWLARVAPARLKGAAGNAFGNLASTLGAGLLILGFVLIDKSSLFPGWWALLPTFGTALLVLGGFESWINRHVLSNRALVWVGLISYPLYLWHWPLLSFAFIQAGGTPSRLLKLAMVALSFVLAWLTYRFVERPLRFGRYGQKVTIGLLVALASLGIVGLASYENELAWRSVSKRHDTYLNTAKIAIEEGGCYLFSVDLKKPDGWFCKLGNQVPPPRAFIYGDSHAFHVFPAFTKYARETSSSFLATYASSCPPLLGVRTASDACHEVNQRVFAYVRDHGIRDVFLVSRWSLHNDAALRRDDMPSAGYGQASTSLALQYGLEKTIEAYRQIGVHAYLLSDNPRQIYIPQDALRRGKSTDDFINELSVTVDQNAAAQGWATRLVSGLAGDSATFVDVGAALCDKDICPLVKDGKFLYVDQDHLSTSGALLEYPKLKEVLDKM